MAKTRSRALKSGEIPPKRLTKNQNTSAPSNNSSIQEAESPKNNKESSQGSDLFADGVARKAIEQLTNFLNDSGESNDDSKLKLFDDSEEKRNIFVQVTTKKFYSGKPNFKPTMIQLPHPFRDQSGEIKTCLFVRDNLVTENEQVEAIEEAKLPTLGEIIPLKSLKEEYGNFEKRRYLKSQYDLFLVDDALLNLMPSVLGKIFYSGSAQKIPLPVKVISSSKPGQLSIDTLKNLIIRVLNSTSFLPPIGINVTVKIGVLGEQIEQQEEHLIQNLHQVTSHFDKHNIKSILIKTNYSPSLPIYYTKTIVDEGEASSDGKASSATNSERNENNETKLSSFETALSELGHDEDVTKVLGKKLKKQRKGSNKSQQKKKVDKS